MKVLHLMACGKNGGIESLMADYAKESKHTNVFLFIWEMGYNAEQIEANGCKTYFVDGHKIGNFRTIKRMTDIIKEEFPDVVVTHHGSPLIRFYIVFLHILQSRIPVVMYCHCNAINEINVNNLVKRKIRELINHLAVRSTSKIITISRFVRESVVKYFHADRDKIHLIYNGVDFKKFDVPIHAKSEKVELIFVGRLIETKGVQIALKAIADLPEKSNIHFSIVGDGPYRETLENLSHKLRIEQFCDFLGKRQDIPQLLAEADIFIHSCVSEEGFGIGIIEAMAAGKICICSDSGAIPEFIVHEENGYLVNEGDIKSLVRCLSRVINEKENWEMIQNNAKNQAKKFDIGYFVMELDELLEEKEQ